MANNYKLYGYRWVVLGVFMFINLTIQMLWIWGDERSPFKFDTGQQPDDPALSDVIVIGNVVHSIGKPRYKYAVIIGGGPNTPRGMHFSNNLLRPGTHGVANTELPP